MSKLRVLKEHYKVKNSKVVIEFLKCGPDEAKKYGHCCEHSNSPECDGSFTCELFSYYDPTLPWRTAIVGRAYIESGKTGKQKDVGTVLANIVNREQIRSVWYDHMYAASPDHLAIAHTVFDRQGYTIRALYEDEAKKGTGVFGKELGEGSFIHLDSIVVAARHRRCGIGSKLIRGLNMIAKKEGANFTLVCPSEQTAASGLTAFVRSLGYRLVARTNILGYALDDNHPSRQLPLHQDSEPFCLNFAERREFIGGYSTPTGIVIATYADKDAARILSKFPVNTDWSEPEESDTFTPVHLAAAFMKPEVLAFLLSRKEGAKCIQIRTVYGDTPLAILERSGEAIRHMPLGMPLMDLDHWRGHTDHYVECYRLLTTVENTAWDEQLEKRVRAGCSCGQCLEGVMSPRLKSYILGHIRHSVTLIMTHWEEEDHCEVTARVKGIFSHLPSTLSDVRNEEPFQRGFAMLLEYIAACLEEEEMPTKSNVKKQIEYFQFEGMGEGDDVQEYFDLGGTLDDALAFLFGECCYKTWSPVFRYLEETKAIPHCDNDDLIIPVRNFVCGVEQDAKSRASSIPPEATKDILNCFLDILTGQCY